VKKILVKGGNRLKGVVRISGAKNAAQPILAASLLTKEKVILHNVPALGDVKTMNALLSSIGADVHFENNTAEITASTLNVDKLSHSTLATQIRGSTHVLAALVPRFKRIEIPLPGGCNIGARNLDIHISGLTLIGARMNMKSSTLVTKIGELHGYPITLKFPSVSATYNIMIAASLAKGITIIQNAAKEPEVVDLANFLNSMGADICGAGTGTIKINGVNELGKTEYTIMPDRIETGTYLAAAAITKGDVLIKNTDLSFLESTVLALKKIGAIITVNDEGVRVTAKERLCSTDIVTGVYPAFPTDMQPVIAALLTVAEGESTMKETIFDNRLGYAQELLKMNADIRVVGDTLHIKGSKKLVGAQVSANDIRSGAALLVASIAAEGNTVIENAQQILRGYEDPVEKLRTIGAECSLIDTA
jgi:UDP-N-acetylglucosamine 1-carboxyvinyltransferase